MITKAERKEVWIDQIKTAIFAAGNLEMCVEKLADIYLKKRSDTHED